MKAVAAANTLQVSDTRLASCLRALGFRYLCKPVVHERTNKLSTQFLFELQSLRFPSLNLQGLLGDWKSGKLLRQDPMHVLCVMMAAQQNYDALLCWLKEARTQALRSSHQGQLTLYEPGPAFLGPQSVETNDDMRLAACVGLLGCPVVNITSSQPGRHLFHIARTGYPVRLSSGELHLHDARVLMERAPTASDPLRLRLEDVQPMHPLCLAYDALYNRTQLKAELSRPHLLLIDEPSKVMAGDNSSGRETLAARQALIDLNAPGHVMDHVTAHMKAPPLAWK